MTRSGYRWDEESGTLVEPSSGAHVRRAADLPIWTKYGASGEEEEHLWIAQGSLDAGVEVPAAVWRYFENRPLVSWLLLEEHGRFHRHRWTDVRREMAEDKIESFATGHFIKRRQAVVV